MKRPRIQNCSVWSTTPNDGGGVFIGPDEEGKHSRAALSIVGPHGAEISDTIIYGQGGDGLRIIDDGPDVQVNDVNTSANGGHGTVVNKSERRKRIAEERRKSKDGNQD